MRYIKIPIDSHKIHLYPIVCWHLGAKQSCRPLIDTVINEIKKDDLARFIYLGDMGECVTKSSKGNIYEQLINPGDQLREGVELLWDIRDKGLFGIRGNHGNRIDKDSGIGWDEMFCSRLGIPYLGVSALAEFAFNRPNTSSKFTASIYCHHGTANSIAPAGKMSAAHKPEQLVVADLMLTAHTHACGRAWPDRVYAYIAANPKADGISYKASRAYACGSAYDSRSGYAEEKMYPVLLPEHVVLKLEVVRIYDENTDKHQLIIEDKFIKLNPETGKVYIESGGF